MENYEKAIALMADAEMFGDHLAAIREEEELGDSVQFQQTDQIRVARVVKVGPGKLVPDAFALTSGSLADRMRSAREPIGLEPGDRIVLHQFVGKEATIDGVQILLVQAGDVVCKLGKGSSDDASADN